MRPFVGAESITYSSRRWHTGPEILWPSLATHKAATLPPYYQKVQVPESLDAEVLIDQLNISGSFDMKD